MTLAQPFTTTSPVIRSVSFTELITNLGFIELYAGQTTDLKLLTSFTYPSNKVAESAVSMSAGSSPGSVRFNHDYDILINKTIVLQGTAVVTIPIKVTNAAAGGNSANGFPIVSLIKDDGSETVIVTNPGLADTVESDATDRGWGADIAYGSPTVDLVIPNNTILKAGETLRLTVEVHGWSVQGAGTITYAHDPANRTQDWDESSVWDSTGQTMTSQIKLLLPTKI